MHTLDSGIPPSKRSLLALIVDDEPSILETFSVILNMQDYQVHTACSAATAIEQLQQHRFDLILTDMSMETSTAGFEVVRAAKAQAHNPAVVIISAYPSLSADWKNQGADAMFQKPTILAELLETLTRLTELRTQNPTG
jgi:CheY-like chemotaxis protein